MIILDTNIISELLLPRPSPGVAAWLAKQIPTQAYLTAVTEAELRFGIAILPTGRRRSDLSEAIEGILTQEFQDRILPFDSDAARAYAEVASTRRNAGRPISEFDCQIAAIARIKNAALATRNIADFENCGVQLINPWEDS